jgi:hypothetical protein
MNTKSLEEKTFDLLESTGLNWSVTKEPLVSAIDGKQSSSFGLFRKDNGTHLDTVTDRYKILQNHEVASALIEATAQVDLTATRGGQLSGGKHIYIQAELPSIFIGKSKSDLKRWLSGLNTHGGKSAAFGSTNTVIVCQNTFHMAFKELSKFRHSESIQERVAEFVAGIRRALGFEQQQIETYKIMADTKIGDEIIARIMKSCFDVNMSAPTNDLSSRQKTKIESVVQSIDTEIKLEGPTVWGLFNGITRYTNHVAGQSKKIKTPEELLSYVMVGEGYETNLTAYKTITEWLIENKLMGATDLVEID